MDASVDARFLARWTESSRRQSEARRFLARQEIPAVERDPGALAEVLEVFEHHGPPGQRPAPIPLRRPVSSVGDLVD